MHTSLLLLFCLIAGTASSLATKTLYQLKAEGVCGSMEFSKPYWMTVAMFIGEAMCLPYFYLFCNKRGAKQSSNDTAINNDMSTSLLPATGGMSPLGSTLSAHAHTSEMPKPPCPKWAFLCLCCFDLTASTLSFVATQWISASLSAMFRGSLVVFVAIFSLFFLRRRLTRGQWGGIGLVSLGLCVVGLSSIFDTGASNNTESSVTLTLVGIFLTILSSALNGLQNVFEEKLMKMLDNYEEPHPMEIVGWEGVFGSLLAGLVMLPVVSVIPQAKTCGGVVENSIDTMEMIKNSWLVLILNLTFIIALGFMNGLSMEIGRVLSAVYRNLVSAVRTISIWVGGVILFYTAGSEYGESVDIYSLIQGAGFIIVVAGSVWYSRSKEITLPETSDKDILIDNVAYPEVSTAHSSFTDPFLPNSTYTN